MRFWLAEVETSRGVVFQDRESRCFARSSCLTLHVTILSEGEKRRPEMRLLFAGYSPTSFPFNKSRSREPGNGAGVFISIAIPEANRDLKQGRTTMAVKTSVKKWICVLSNLIAPIWTCSICQIQATFPEVGFLKILFRFEKMKENSSSYVLHKTWN